MNKKIYPLVMFAVAAVFAACSDDVVVDVQQQIPETIKTRVQIDTRHEDLACGYNLLVFDVTNDDATVDIPLGNKGNVTFVNKNASFRYEKTTDFDGKPCLRLNLKNVNFQTILTDEIKLTATDDSTLEHRLLIHLRKGVKEPEAISTVTEKGIRCLGLAMHPLSNLDAAMKPVFSQELLRKLNDENAGIVRVNQPGTTTNLQFHESSNSTSHQTAKNFRAGLHVTAPLKGLTINFGIESSTSFNDLYEETREYMEFTKNTIEGSATVNKWKPSGALNEEESYIYFISRSVNDILNNPGSPDYKKYPNTEEGICKLIDDLHGFQFNTSVVLGGEVTAELSKKKTLSSHSFEEVIDATIEIKKRNEGFNINDSATYAKFNKFAQLGEFANAAYAASKEDKPSGGGHFGTTWKDIQELKTMDLTSSISQRGGSDLRDNDPNSWVLTKDPKNYAILSFSNLDYLNRISCNSGTVYVGNAIENSEIHDLLELFVDTTHSERYQALKKMITPDPATGIIRYYEMKNVYCPYSEARMVVVDAKLDFMENNEYPIYGTRACDGPNGQVYAYYPLVTNANGQNYLDVWFDKVFNVNDFKFCGSNWKSRKPLVLWVAVDWAKKDPKTGMIKGITDIFIDHDGKQDAIKGYYHGNIYTDQNINSDAANGRRYLYVKYANSKTTIDELITGVSIYATKWDGDNGNKRGKVMASSAGTDFLRPYNEPKNQDYFNNYWDEDSIDWVRGENTGHLDSFIKVKYRRPKTCNVGYTRKPITRDLSGINTEKITTKAAGLFTNSSLPRTDTNILIPCNWK